MDALPINPLLAELNKSLFKGCWFVSAVATADAVISVSCAGVVGTLRVGSVTVLATTLNEVDDDDDDEEEEEEDTAPELFLVSSHSARFFVGVRYVACSTLNSKIDYVRF